MADGRREVEEDLRGVDRDGVGAQRRLRGEQAQQHLVDAGVEQMREPAEPGAHAVPDRLGEQPQVRAPEPGAARRRDAGQQRRTAWATTQAIAARSTVRPRPAQAAATSSA